MERDNSRSKFAVEHVPREFTGILDARLSPFVDTNVSVEYYDEYIYICIKYLDTVAHFLNYVRRRDGNFI